ncbi:MAG: gamma-glutamylcyclotransferase [Hyphomicrobiaceae bacterium]
MPVPARPDHHNRSVAIRICRRALQTRPSPLLPRVTLAHATSLNNKSLDMDHGLPCPLTIYRSYLPRRDHNDTAMLDRDAIKNGAMLTLNSEDERLGLAQLLTDKERAASKRAVLADHDSRHDIWVFGYGSLMWNPAIHFTDRRPARIFGYHRQYCLSSPVGRGTPDQPGIMLALDRGGSCHGAAYRIAASNLHAELDILWAREMVVGTYRPAWVTIHTDVGQQAAITFVGNNRHERYVGKLPVEAIIERLATAAGRLGSCREYLANTVSSLEALGIRNGTMHRLLQAVEAHCAEAQMERKAEHAQEGGKIA